MNANVFITSTQETINQVTTTVNQITNSEGVAAGDQFQVQFNNQDVLAGDSGLTYNPTTKILSLTGNIITTSIRTNNLLQANGDNWLFSYSNANTGRYLSTHSGNITGNVITGLSFNGEAANLANITGANVTGYVPNATNANASNRANTVVSADQPNITTVGTLATLSVYGNSFTSNITTDGTVEATFFVGDGADLTNLTGAEVTGIVANANYAGYSNIAETVSTNAQPNITSLGTLTSLTISNEGAGNINSENADLGNMATANYFFGSGNNLSNIRGPNVNGVVANANYAAYAGNIITAAQPNITSLGTLTGVSVSKEANATGGGSTVGIAGLTTVSSDFGSSDYQSPASAQGVRGRVTGSDLTETNNFIVGVTGSYNVTGTNASEFPKAGVIGAVGDQSISADAAFIAYVDGDGGETRAGAAFKVAMINTTGNSGFDYGVDLQWLDTGVLNSTADFKVADIRLNKGVEISGNATTMIVAGNVSADYILGDGGLLSNLSIASTPEANYANFAGEAFSVTGSNVDGQVSYAATANAVAGANVSGQVGNALIAGTVFTNAQPNITSVGTLASLSVSGNAAVGNLSTAGSVTGANLTGTILTAAQTNITSVGTLTSLSITGNVAAGNANLGNLAQANFFSGDGRNLTNIAGASVTGTVANATYADTAGTVSSNIQSNITSVGTLASLSVSGNATIANISSTGNIKAGGELSVISDNGHGGANYAGILTMTNTNTGATNPNKYIRLNPTGAFEIVNSAYSETIMSLTDAGTLNAILFSGSGANLSNLPVANISGLGNIATVNLDGNSANVLSGAGTWLAAGGGYSNSNVSTYLNAFGSNTITTTGNVSVGNILATNLGNVSSINTDGNSSNVLYGNGVFAAALSGATTGNVTFNDVNIIGTGHLYLQPDSTNASANLDIFLTTGPDIHIASPGDSNLILGRDAGANVTVNTNGNVSIQAYSGSAKEWVFDVNGNLNVPANSAIQGTDSLTFEVPTGSSSKITSRIDDAHSNSYAVTTDYTTATYTDNSGSGKIDITGSSLDMRRMVEFYLENANSGTAKVTINGNPTELTYNGYGWDLTTFTIYLDETPAVDPTTITEMTLSATVKNVIELNDAGNQLNLQSFSGWTLNIRSGAQGDVNIQAGDDVTITSRDDVFINSGDDIFLNGGDKDAAGSSGGQIDLNAGDGGGADDLYDAGPGGYVNLRGGVGGGASTSRIAGAGGIIELAAGLGGGANNAGSQEGGIGGTLNLYAGDAGANDGNASLGKFGGNVNIHSGLSTGPFIGGSINIDAGAGGTGYGSGNIIVSTHKNDGSTTYEWVFDNAGNLTASATSNANLGNLVTANAFSGDGHQLSNIALANVSGIGNIASVNLTSSTSNVLYGNGTFAAPIAEPSFSLISHTASPLALNAGKRYLVDTLSDTVEANLPASPATGDAIYFLDAFGKFSINNFTINGNGSNIMGTSSPLVSIVDESSFGLVYNGVEWRIYH